MTNEAIFIIIAIVVLVPLCVLLAGFMARCPSCKKFFARKLTDRKELDRFMTTKTVTHYDIQRDSSGKEIGRTERRETVPVTRVKYQDSYRCKKCNHSWQTITHRDL